MKNINKEYVMTWEKWLSEEKNINMESRLCLGKILEIYQMLIILFLFIIKNKMCLKILAKQ